MRTLMLSSLALMLLAVSSACAAQTVIHHCISADGTPLFTDQPCDSLDATPVAKTTIPDTASRSPLAPHAPTGPKHCPLDIPTLKARVAAAFKTRDANALAGLMLWRGYHDRGATHTVKQLAQLMQWPFLGFAQADKKTPSTSTISTASLGLPPLSSNTVTQPPAPPDTLTLKLANPARPQVSFRIIQRDGCYWLEP